MAQVETITNVQNDQVQEYERQIRDFLDDMRKHEKEAAKDAIEIGKLLIEAKKTIEHGKWAQWLEDNFNLSQRVANNLMKCAQRFGINSPTSANLNQSQMIEMLTLPEGEEQAFIKAKKKEGIPVNEMTIKELRSAIKEWKSPASKIPSKEEDQKCIQMHFSTDTNTTETIRSPDDNRYTTLLSRYEQLKKMGAAYTQQQERALEQDRENIAELLKEISDQEKKIKSLQDQLWDYEQKEYDTNLINRFNSFCDKLYKRNPDARRLIDCEGNEGLARFIRESFFYEHVRYKLRKRGITLPEEVPEDWYEDYEIPEEE